MIPSGTAAQKARRIALSASSMATRKRALQLDADGGLVPQGRAQVSMQHTPQPARVLDIHRPVKAQPLPQLLKLFWRDRATVAFCAPQDRQRRVPGDNP